MKDVRAQLEALAKGKLPAQAGPGQVDEALVQQHGRAFNAWQRFADGREGEPIVAPAALLVPLP